VTALGRILGGSHVRGIYGLQKVTVLLSRVRTVVANPGYTSDPPGELLKTLSLMLHLDHQIKISWDGIRASGFFF